MFDVYLLIQPAPDLDLSRLGTALSSGPFVVEIEQRDDDLLGVWCRGIHSTGAASFPESLRLAQTGLSMALKNAYPTYAERGGLLWRDVLRAEVHTAS